MGQQPNSDPPIQHKHERLDHRRTRHRKRSRRDIADQRQHFLTALRGQTTGRDKAGHKTPMLCRQVYRALTFAFGGEIADPVLAQLTVLDVRPLDGAGHLLVRVAVPNDMLLPSTDDHNAHARASTLAEIVDRLARARPAIRSIIASSITRKRVPELSFIPTFTAGES
jgi:ribosome-binding factor A